jgi:hypothetical protein
LEGAVLRHRAFFIRASSGDALGRLNLPHSPFATGMMDRGTQKVAPDFSDYVDAFRDVAGMGRQAALRIYALLPLGLVVGALRSLHTSGWLKFPGVWMLLSVLLALSCLWYRASLKARYPALLAGLVVCAASVICFSADWIVQTRYDFRGRGSMDFYVPQRSPLWREPRPEQLLPGAKSWEDDRFFDFGKDWIAVGKPWLEVNWLMVILRMMAYTSIPYVVFSGILVLVPNLVAGRR